MRWFGDPWGAPICQESEEAPVPVGEPCRICGKLFTKDSQGLLIPHYSSGAYEEKPWHIVCFTRSISGLPEGF